jgi:hypothetical protein
LLLPGTTATQTLQVKGQLDLPGAGGITDVWGYVDALGGKEYAIVGNNWQGLQVVDVTEPTNPILRTTFTAAPRQDIKSWQHYVYTVDGNLNLQGAPGVILDFTNPLSPVVVGSIPAGHNLFIDAEGYLYVSYPGLRIFDLNPDPANPQLVWEDMRLEGHDVCVAGDRLYNFSGPDGTFFYDISDRSNPVPLDSITDPTILFHHSGWVSDDGAWLFVNDEFAVHPSPDITVWYVGLPGYKARLAEFADGNATVHNSFVMGNYLFAAYYTAGIRVLDIERPWLINMSGEYDTSPLTGEGVLQGAWGLYTLSPSGCIFVSDRGSGLFIFGFESQTTAIGPTVTPPGPALRQNYPNPFNPTTTIEYRIVVESPVMLSIFDAKGREVRALVDEEQPAGDYSVGWNGRDNAGNRVSSGVYFYRIKTGAFMESKRLVFLK